MPIENKIAGRRRRSVSGTASRLDRQAGFCAITSLRLRLGKYALGLDCTMSRMRTAETAPSKTGPNSPAGRLLLASLWETAATKSRALSFHAPRFTGWALVGTCVFFASFLTGCGYTTQRPYRTDMQTVHVEMFQSREFRRELEFRLTESVAKRIEMDTPYRIAPREKADVLLTGEVLAVHNRTLGEDFDTDLPREIGSNVVVRYTLKDLRTGEILVDRPRAVFQTSYIPPVGETFSTGMTRAMDGLAEQIVESMESAW
jgi:hypothetical protein